MGTSFCSTLTTCTSSGAGAALLVGRVHAAGHNAPINIKAMRSAGIFNLRIVSLSFHLRLRVARPDPRILQHRRRQKAGQVLLESPAG
jgi:hypothetical protein